MSERGLDPRTDREDLHVLRVLLMCLSGQGVVSISKADAGSDTHLVELLAVAGDGVGEVDDVEDLGAAEAGDLHGSHEGRLGECVRTNRALGAPGQGWSAAGAARPAADDVACVAAQLAGTFRRSSDADPGTAV